MARIPEAELARLKREVSLLTLAQAAGVELKRHGANWLGCCPFHDDASPSLVITPSKNLWHCLGACQAGGSVIDWVMRVERVSFRHAMERLRQQRPGGSIEAAPAPAPTLALSPEMDDATLMRAVIGFYHRQLLVSPEALAYLVSRGLDHREMIDHFQLGYANRTLGYALPSKVLKAGAAIRGRLQTLGVLRESGHEHFTGSVIVPVLSPTGEVTEVYGRKINDHLREGTPYHLYLPGPHRGVWNEQALAESKEIILCEALFDALSFWVAGYRNVTASYGTHGFTAEHLAAFKKYGTERVLIAYDRDEAGDTAAAALAAQLAGAGLACYRVQFPLGLDANAYALKCPPAAASLGERIRQATWLGAGPAVARALPRTAERACQGVRGALPCGAPTSSLAASSLPDDSPTTPSLTTSGPPHADREPLVSPEPAPALPPIPVTVGAHELTLTLGDRTYRVRGLAKNTTPETLRVTLLVQRSGGPVFSDALDLYGARARALYASQAARLLDVTEELLAQDLGALLLRLEGLRDAALAESAEPTAVSSTPAPTHSPAGAAAMTAEERREALALLKDPALLERLVADAATLGMVGERTNLLVGTLAAVSRKLPRPLAVIIQSASAAGKTALMEAILALVPPEERVHYTAMTGQALYYLGESDLKHKVLSVVEEEGAERAAYALKLLQSEGALTIASTGKDPQSGKLVTHTYRVEGPVQLMLTTTALTLDEELANRALVLTVDESAAQTRAIHQRQREARTLEGLLARSERSDLLRRWQNAQRLLESIAIVNPYAPTLAFGDARTRARRDHEKYLTLIDAIALLHQHQREHKTVHRGGQALTYLEVTASDLALAEQLASEVLARSRDELPPQTRRCLALLQEWVARESAARPVSPPSFRFSAREARAATGLGATQMKLHLHRLVELEELVVHRSHRGLGVVYELVEPPPTGEASSYDAERPDSGAIGRGVVGPRSGGGRTARNGAKPNADEPLPRTGSEWAEARRRSAAPAAAVVLVP
jgi:DNA primase catalytic core